MGGGQAGALSGGGAGAAVGEPWEGQGDGSRQGRRRQERRQGRPCWAADGAAEAGVRAGARYELKRRLDEGLKPEPGEPQEAWDRRVYRERAASGEPIGEYLRWLHGELQALPAYLLDRPSVWLEDESAASSATVERDLVPRVPSPPPPDATASDAYGGESADCGSGGLAVLGAEVQREREQRVAERERREAEDYNDGYERVMERAWHDEGRRSYFYGKPAAELSPDAVVPPEWEPRNALEAERQARRERLERLLADRAAAGRLPPPYRSEPRYAPMVGNPAGDEAFRTDRADWYARITGERIHELDVGEQQALCDVVARRFRAYGDGRPERACHEAMPLG